MTGGLDTTLHLNPTEAELFKLFCQYQDSLKVLIDNGVFQVRKGQVIVSFNGEGVITDVDINVKAYKRTYPQPKSTILYNEDA
jgi:hypothetical protein